MGPEPREWTAERLLEKAEYDLNSGCWLWPGAVNDDGYGCVYKFGKRHTIHRMAYELFVEEIPKLGAPTAHGWVVMHKCDTPGCFNPDHLRLGTQIQNIKDRHAKGRSSKAMGIKGEASVHSKLTELDVLAIREKIKAGIRDGEIALEYEVCRGTILHIRQNKSWSHV